MPQWFSFLLLIALWGMPTYALNALDEDFFNNQEEPSNQPGLQALNPDFFRDNLRGSLPGSQPGEFGCSVVSAKSQAVASARAAEFARAYCTGPANIRWIPRMQGWNGVPQSYNNNNFVAYYGEICCHKKDLRRRRRY